MNLKNIKIKILGSYYYIFIYKKFYHKKFKTTYKTILIKLLLERTLIVLKSDKFICLIKLI